MDTSHLPGSRGPHLGAPGHRVGESLTASQTQLTGQAESGAHLFGQKMKQQS